MTHDRVIAKESEDSSFEADDDTGDEVDQDEEESLLDD